MQVADQAAECLTKTIATLSGRGSNSLAESALQDDQICGDLMASLLGPEQQNSEDSRRRMEALTRVVAAVSQYNTILLLVWGRLCCVCHVRNRSHILSHTVSVCILGIYLHLAIASRVASGLRLNPMPHSPRRITLEAAGRQNYLAVCRMSAFTTHACFLCADGLQ